MNDLYSVRMRASSGDEHISGAERIVPEKKIQEITAEIVGRALTHERGRPDTINISIESIDSREIVSLPALPITTIEVPGHSKGRERAIDELARAGVSEAAARSALAAITAGAAAPGRNMRGAMIMDAVTGERLEPDRLRGIRTRHVDYGECFLPELVALLRERGLDGTHIKEALALATKIANAPFSVAELCISDDPGYVTGYVASKEHGYVRITRLKEPGDPYGGRTFFVDGSRFELGKYIGYMREAPMLITGPVEIKNSDNAESTFEPSPPTPLPDVLKRTSHYRRLRTVEARDGVKATIEGKQYTLFCSNDYLGLSTHPAVKAAAGTAINDAGSGSGSAPLIAGHSKYHQKLQEDIARFKGAESSLLFGSGYLANIGLIQSLTDRDG